MTTDPPQTSRRTYRYLFGPVPSRRLGRSLGVDLLPRKTCSFNCIFCQVGATTDSTVGRREYVPAAAVLTEIDDWLESGGSADHITLAGSGEPTLHSCFGEILRTIKARTSIETVLLTNSSLLHLPQVRADACAADVVKVSLSAWDEQSFEQINRPHPAVCFDELLDGLQAFRAEFSGELWLETFVLAGINADTASMRKISTLARNVRPDRVHLNTVVRPPADGLARPVSSAVLAEFASLFDPPAEIIAPYNSNSSPVVQASREEIVAMLERRPCTASDIAAAFGTHVNEVAKDLTALLEDTRINAEHRDNDVYYTAPIVTVTDSAGQ